MPHPGQRPIVRKTPLFCLTGSAALLFGSVAVTAATVLYFPFGTAVAVISMIVTAGTFRAFHNFLLHHASHGDFGARSALVGELAGILALTQPYRAYRRDHTVHHAGLTSDDDPDQRALLALGFRPGLPREAYPGVLRRALLSPATLARTVGGRVGENLHAPGRAAVVLAVHGLPLPVLAGWSAKALLAWALAWLLPLTVGYHVSMVLYAIGLHAWFSDSGEPGWAAYAEKTGARFFGDRCPPRGAVLGWAVWWGRLLAGHLVAARLLVVGFTDNGCHDAHHIDPKGRRFDWCNSAYARMELMAGWPQARAVFWHSWSLNEAISDNFARLAASAANDRHVA